MPNRVPKGAAIALPKGADLVVHLHYHPSGKAEQQALKDGVDVSHLEPARSRRIKALKRSFDRAGNGVLNDHKREELIRFLKGRANL